jgi:glutathionylspermidine synthase
VSLPSLTRWHCFRFRCSLGVSDCGAAWLKWSAASGHSPVMGRMDFVLSGYDVVTGAFQPKLLEYNGDTPGIVIESTLYCAASEAHVVPKAGLRSGAYLGYATAQLASAIEAVYSSRLVSRGRPVALLHHFGDPYIVELAQYLEAAVVRAGHSNVTRVVYPSVPGVLQLVATPR